MRMSDPKDIELKVGLIKKDVEAVADHTNRLDGVVEQLKDLSESMAKMIAIHEEKHIQHDREEERLIKHMTKQSETHKKDLAHLEGKIDEDNKLLHARISSTEEKVIGKIEEAMKTKADKEESDKVSTRVSKLEKIVWMGLGALAILQFAIPIALKFIF